MYANALYTGIQHAMHIYPTIQEFIPSTLGQLKPSEQTSSKFRFARANRKMSEIDPDHKLVTMDADFGVGRWTPARDLSEFGVCC